MVFVLDDFRFQLTNEWDYTKFVPEIDPEIQFLGQGRGKLKTKPFGPLFISNVSVVITNKILR